MTALTLSPAERDLFRIVMAVRQLTEGRSNAVGTVTLSPGAASTTVSAPNCARTSAIFLFPQTANAAAALATTWVQPSATPPINPAAGQFVISHANNAQTDRTFWYVALG